MTAYDGDGGSANGAHDDSKERQSDGWNNDGDDGRESDNSFSSVAWMLAGGMRAFLLALGKYGLHKGVLKSALTKRAFLTIGRRTTYIQTT